MAILLESSSEASYRTGEDSATGSEGDHFYDAPSQTSRIKANASRIRQVKEKVKHKTTVLVTSLDPRQSADHDHDHDGGRPPAHVFHNDPAFSPQKPLRDHESSLTDTVFQIPERLYDASNTIRHPSQAVKAHVASRVARSDQPQMLDDIDSDLLDAHEKLSAAQLARESCAGSPSADGNSDADEDEDNEDDEDAQEIRKLTLAAEDIGDRKESLRVAYNTKRFVYRARTVPYHSHVPCPRWSDFRQFDAQGQYIRFQWERWLGHLLLFLAQDCGRQYLDDCDEPPFDPQTLTRTVERIIIASAPWQEWLASLHRIARWDDPRITGRWMALFVFLWVTDYVISFIYVYVIALILRSRYTSSSVEQLRESRRRAVDHGLRALRFTEIVQRHGRTNWVDPLLDELGPLLQRQLGDLADHLEVLINLYEWRDLRSTRATLFFLLSCLALGVATPTGYSMRAFTFIWLLAFFAARPLAARWPRYRRLVSPVKWAFWGNPTHAEWAVTYLQQRTRETLASTTAAGVAATTVSSSDPVLPSFRCRSGARLGELLVRPHGLAFRLLLADSPDWERGFDTLREMEKRSQPGLARVGKRRLLKLAFAPETAGDRWSRRGGGDGERRRDDEEVVVFDMGKRRDEAFNVILGFSGRRWMPLQPESEKLTEANGH